MLLRSSKTHARRSTTRSRTARTSPAAGSGDGGGWCGHSLEYDDDDCIVVVACGDSITRGGHGVKGDDWPELAQVALGNSYLVINRGVGGSTLTDLTGRAWIRTDHGEEALDDSRRADAFIVALGTNDAKSGEDAIWPNLAVGEFVSEYEAVLDQLRDASDEGPVMFEIGRAHV